MGYGDYMSKVKYDPAQGNDQHLTPETRKALAEWKERQRQKFLRESRITRAQTTEQESGGQV